MYYNELPTLIQKLPVLSSHLNTQHIVLLSTENIIISGMSVNVTSHLIK